MENIKPKVGSVIFIAVDGHGGSGKSTFAKLLAEKLNAQIIETDYFASWNNPLDWWPLAIKHVFEPIMNGATTLNYPRSKWSQDSNPDPIVDQPVTKFMILEGVSSLRKEFRDYISFGIFVDTPKDVCLQRGVERDLTYNYKKSSSELTAMWDKWFENEDVYIKRDNPQAHADIVIDGTKPFEKQAEHCYLAITNAASSLTLKSHSTA